MTFISATSLSTLASLFSLQTNLRSLLAPPSSVRCKRFAMIDGFRALAIFWLILFHSVWMSGFFYEADTFEKLTHHKELSWIVQGHMGVDIFFVISGFLIGYILLKEIKSTGGLRFKHFYFRRALRILPAYFFILFLLVILTSKNNQALWANLLFVNNLLPVKDQFMLWSWSLAIEEQFYLICPFLLVFLYRRHYSIAHILMGLFIASFIIRYVIIVYESLSPPFVIHSITDKTLYYHMFDSLYDKTYTRFGPLIIGVLTAFLYLEQRPLQWLETKTHWRRLFLLLASLTIIFLIALPWFWLNETSDTVFTLIITSYRNLFSLAIAYLIFYSLTSSGKMSWINRFLSAKYWYPIAQLSYSAFLIHLIVIFVIGKSLYARLPIADHPYLLVPMISLFMLVTFGLSILMYLFIERPFMNYRS